MIPTVEQGEIVRLLLFVFLASLRFLGLFSLMVLLTGTAFPATVRLGLSFALGVVILPLCKDSPIDVRLLSSLPGALLACFREILCGGVLGTLASAPIYALQMTGSLIAQQMGLSISETVDPMSDSKTSPVGQMKTLLGTWFWFYWGGHLLMIQAVMETFRMIPVGSPLAAFLTLDGISLWIKGLFVLSAKMFLPYFGLLLAAEIGLGAISKALPQMNIFMLGFPVKILLGIFLLAIMALSIIQTAFWNSTIPFLELFPRFIGR
ncbi:MAG: flagellar biosynthetic protein FliR [Synergistales bacterium]